MSSLFSSSFTFTVTTSTTTNSKFRILAAAPKSPRPSALAKTTATVVASAALFLSSLHSPTLAANSPIPTITTTSESEAMTYEEKMYILLKDFMSPDPSFLFCKLLNLSKNLPEVLSVVDGMVGEKAKEEYEDLLNKEPYWFGIEKRKCKLRELKMQMAQAWIVQGEYENSRLIFEEIVKEDSSDCKPYLCLGIIYTLLEKNDEAEKQFQTYRNLIPEGYHLAKFLDETILAIKASSKLDEDYRKCLLRDCFWKLNGGF